MANSDNLYIRELTESDEEPVLKIDDASGFCVSMMIDIPSYAYGAFVGDTLVGYCTAGLADWMSINTDISKYPGYTGESILLCDVFVLPEHRHQRIAHRMIEFVITQKTSNSPELMFLQADTRELVPFYMELGFEPINEYDMVFKPKH